MHYTLGNRAGGLSVQRVLGCNSMRGNLNVMPILSEGVCFKATKIESSLSNQMLL